MMSTAMTNKNDILCKSEIKNDYLEDTISHEGLSRESAKAYARIFNIIFELEEKAKKDLYDFTFEEVEEILLSFNANNRNTIESYARIISAYLNWCVKQKKTNKNVLSHLKPDDFSKYLTNEETYFTYNQLRRYGDRCENYQDMVIPNLIFIGLSGKQMSEIRNLKKDDVDPKNNRLKLIETLKADKKGLPVESTYRYLDDIDEYTMKNILEAMKETTYMKKNGDISQTENNNVRPHTDLVSNEYVLRPSITKTENWSAPVDRFVVYRRLQQISESLGIEDFTAKRIQRSGMIYYANKIIGDRDEVTINDLKRVADRFNIKSYHNLKGIITIENIRKTYPKK